MKTSVGKVFIAANIIYILLIAAFAFLWKHGSFDADPVSEIRAENRFSQTLTVVADNDYRPYSFINEEGSPDGHDAELAAELANRLGMNLRLTLTGWSEALEMMENGKADIIMGIEMLVDDKAHSFISATVPISSDSLTVFSRKPFGDTFSLNGLTMAELENNEGREEVLRSCGVRDVRHTAYPTYQEAVKAVSEGKNDFVVMRYVTGMQILKETGVKNVRPSLALTGNYMCFGIDPANEELMAVVNAELERMFSDGTLKKLNEKWLESIVSGQPLKGVFAYYPWLYFAAGAMALFYLFLLNLLLTEKNRQKILARSMRRDSNYQRALFYGSYAFVECNITQNTVEGEYSEINNGVPVPAGYKLGIRPPYSFTELFEWWYDKLYIGSEPFLEPEGIRERLLARFEEGQRLLTLTCSARNPSMEIRHQQISLHLSRDNSSKDIIGLCIIKDVTKEEKERASMEINQKLSRALARNYMKVFYINLPNNSVALADGSITAYPAAFLEYVTETADPDDLPKLMRLDSTEGIEAALKEKDSAVIMFKNKDKKYCSLRMVRTGENEHTVVMGFAERYREAKGITEGK